MLSSEETRWFALRVRPRHEKSVAHLLGTRGWESFLPLYRSRSQWSDRMKTVQLPLFPGYVFCRSDRTHGIGGVVSTPGVVHVVSFGIEPQPIEEQEITRLRRLVDTDLNYHPWPYVRVGERVRLCYGPLSGMEGIVDQVKNSVRVVISVEMLQRSVAVEIDGDWVVPGGAVAPVGCQESGRRREAVQV